MNCNMKNHFLKNGFFDQIGNKYIIFAFTKIKKKFHMKNRKSCKNRTKIVLFIKYVI